MSNPCCETKVKIQAEVQCMWLIEHDQVINDQRTVSNVLNQYYVRTITEHIGQPDGINECGSVNEVVQPHRNHDSARFTREHLHSLEP